MIASIQDAQAPDLRAAVRIILSTRRVEQADACDCSVCTEVKAQPFQCRDCGYVGRPHTFSCTCADDLASHLASNEAFLATYPTQSLWPVDWKTSRTQLVADTQALRRVRTVGLCSGNGAGMPGTGARLFGWEGNCCHSTPTCPVCSGGYGDLANGASELPVSLLAILRELNALVAR